MTFHPQSQYNKDGAWVGVDTGIVLPNTPPFGRNMKLGTLHVKLAMSVRKNHPGYKYIVASLPIRGTLRWHESWIYSKDTRYYKTLQGAEKRFWKLRWFEHEEKVAQVILLLKVIWKQPIAPVPHGLPWRSLLPDDPLVMYHVGVER